MNTSSQWPPPADRRRAGRWPIDKQLRSYVFFFTNARGKTTYRAVDEYMAAAGTGRP